MIVEGPPEDPGEMEADIDYFMKHAKVLRWLQPPRPSLFRVAQHLFLPLTSVLAHFGFQSALCPSLRALPPASLIPKEAVFPLPPYDAFCSRTYCCLSLCAICLHSVSAAVSRWS